MDKGMLEQYSEKGVQFIDENSWLIPPSSVQRWARYAIVRCPLSVDQIRISVKSCPLMAEG
jgi:hypothetical protein